MQILCVDRDAALPLTLQLLPELLLGAGPRLDERDLSALVRGARDHDFYARELVPGAGLLKAMMDRLVCADGGNPDPRSTHGKQLAGNGIRPTPLRPSRSRPPTQPSGEQPPDNLPDFGAEIPMGRPSQLAEFAPIYVLASGESSYATGQVYVQRGRGAGWAVASRQQYCSQIDFSEKLSQIVSIFQSYMRDPLSPNGDQSSRTV